MQNKYADTELFIDLEAIAANYRMIRDRVSPAICAAVIKADAYGLGIEEVAKKLHKTGCRKFFVATLDEGIELRKTFALLDIPHPSPLPEGEGIRVPNPLLLGERTKVPSSFSETEILVFNGIRAGQGKAFLEYGLTPVINDCMQLEVWNSFAAYRPTKLKAALQIDTGMNRLGLCEKDANFIKRNDVSSANIEITYVMSHLACAGTPDHLQNARQLEAFRNLRKLFPDAKACLANSAGCFLGDKYHFDMVRPGIALYGSNGGGSTIPELETVVTLKSKILQLRDIEEKEPVGYGATAEVEAGTRLATIPVGYADGYLRSLSNNSFAFIDNVKVPVIGRVSMDSIVLDVTKIPEHQLNLGMEVELLGKNCRLDDIAKNAGTIGYEILTGLGSRYKRVYIND